MDIAIIGGGFVGLFLARHLLRAGYSPIIYEEHGQIGLPPHCTGLISRTGMARLGLLRMVEERGLIKNEVRCAKIYFKTKRITVCLKDKLLVIDRPALDQELALDLASRGLKIKLNNKVNKIKTDGSLWVNGKKQKFDVIILAEGGSRRLIRRIDPNINLPTPAMQMDVEYQVLNIDADYVHIIKIPDFFIWVVPIDKKQVRIGLASQLIRNKGLLLDMLAKKIGKIRKVIARFGGFVNFDGPTKRFVYGRIAGVGDVVGQTKPISGGGVVWGGLSAKILASVIKKFDIAEKPELLKVYEVLWRRIFGFDVAFMKLVRNAIFNYSTHGLISTFVRFVPSKIEVGSDYDFPLLSRILSSRR